MRPAILHSLAQQYRMPVPAAEGLAAAVAERCALIANRYEHAGNLEVADLALIEAVGAEIGAAILAAFPPPERMPPVDPASATGIGGPRRR